MFKPIINSKDDIFILKKDGYYVNFVGYYQFYDNNDNLTMIYSFPKYYKYVEQSEIWDIICTFELAETLYDEDGDEINNGDMGLLQPYVYVIDYYKKFGLIHDDNKSYKYGGNGLINWNKTIGREIPKLVNENYFFEKTYNRHITKKETLLSEIMYVILTQICSEFDFLEKKLNLKKRISNIEFCKLGRYLPFLHNEVSITFIDSRRKLILAIIAIIETWRSASEVTHGIFVNKYSHIYESLNDNLLGVYYDKKSFVIGRGQSESSIILDHYSEDKKAIIDSKYYKYGEKLTNEYKQYFYLMHVLSVHQEDKSTDWKNILLKPNFIDDKIFMDYELDRSQIDGMNLWNLYVNIRSVVFYYTRNEEYDEFTKCRNGENEYGITF